MGPLEFLVLTFPGDVPQPEAIGGLARLRADGDVRVVDSLLVAKDADGRVTTAELADLPELADVVAGRDLAALIDAEDADEVAELLEPGTCAVAALVEHRWADEAAAAVRAAGGALAASVRIPAGNVPDTVEAS